jgi:peptidoglycan/xylan/chitin deacetylase (PgdA/CDA1 family)
MNYFNSEDEFYINFYKVLNADLEEFFNKNKNVIKNTKIKFLFHSIEDIKFRLVRDRLLTKDEYEKNMSLMMKEKNFQPKKHYSQLFFDKKDLNQLNSLGHLIGLHSHNHPTLLESLSYDEQKLEYENCISVISKIIDKPKNEIKFMSHPCGSYNNHTLEILKKLGIELGFKEIMTADPERGMKKINNSYLEIARQDHAEIVKRMN